MYLQLEKNIGLSYRLLQFTDAQKGLLSLVATNARQSSSAWMLRQTEQWSKWTIVTPFVSMATTRFRFSLGLNKLGVVCFKNVGHRWIIITFAYVLFRRKGFLLRQKWTWNTNTRNKAHFKISARARWLCRNHSFAVCSLHALARKNSFGSVFGYLWLLCNLMVALWLLCNQNSWNIVCFKYST